MLGCRPLRLQSQSSAGLRMQPYPRSPDLVWPGHLHGTGCLSARAMDTGFPTVAWRLRFGLGCGWVWVSAAPRHSWLGCWGVCVLVYLFRLYLATPGWGVRCGCVCLGSGFGCAPPFLAGVLGCVCACVRAPLAPRHFWLGCAVWVCVLQLGFSAAPRHSWQGCWGVYVLVCVLRLYPATPGWRVQRGCCAWARVSVAPPHSWLGWRGLCLLVCAPRLHPATPGWDVRCGCVCLGSGFGCAPPHLAGVLWCACLCVCSPCTPPLLAGARGVGVSWVRVSAAPRHCWLGCWGVCVVVWALPLYPATPGWSVRCGCGCLASGFGCAPPLLAGVSGFVSACVRAPLAPRHSWLGCAVWGCVFGLGFRLRPATPGWGVRVCVFVCVLPLYPATPGWGVRCGCVCLGSGFGCAPPLLAGVLGCVCARVRAPLVPRHSWLGCAVWVSVLGLGFRLRPATPGWGVGVCVFVCVLPLYPATPGWGVRCGCRCLGSGFGCAPPLPAGVLGCACLCACSPCTRHSWLGCAACVYVFGFVFRLRPATPGWGVGVCVWWCGRSPCTPPLLAGVCGAGVGVSGSGFGCAPPLLAWVLGCACWCACSPCTPPPLAGVCGVGVRVWARVSAAPRHTWLGCCGVRVCVCAPLVPRHSWLGRAAWVCLGFGFRLRPATAGWGVGVCVWWCGRSPCTPPLLAGVCGAGVGVWALASAAPRHSWLGCRGLCLLVCAPRLHPATPGWVVRCGGVCLGWGFACAPPLLAVVSGCACLCACSPCTPPLLAGVCGVGVCAWVRVSAAPRHSWLGCWGVCVLLCALRLYPATPGWGVRCGCLCLGSGFGCAPPLLAGVLGCVCLCACSPCTPPPLAGVCGVGVGVWARVSAAPRHSWLGCWGVHVCVRAPLVPATPGWGVRRACMCLGSGFACAPPLLAGVLGCVCGGVGAPLVPRHSWLGCAVRVWVFRARVSAAPRHSWLGCWAARVGVRAPPVPRHPWLGCAAWVCVFGLGFRLRPATAGWGVGVCVCWCARSACPPPLLAGVCGVGVRVWARVSAAPRHSWLGCWGVCVLVSALRLYPATPGWGMRRGCVLFGLGFRLRPASPGWGAGVCVCWCVCSSCTPPPLAGVCVVGVCARARVLAAPRHSWLGFVVCGLGVSWHLSLCRGSLRVVRAARVCGTRWPLLLGSFPCALVVACGVPLWRASWPRFGSPRLVRSGRSRCSGWLSRRRGAFPHPGGLRPRLYWVTARGTRRPAENRAHCACRLPPPRQGRWARSASYPFGAPRWGCPWRVLPTSVLGCVRCGVLRVWTRSLTRPVSRTVRRSTGDSAGAPGLFRVDADTAPFWSEDATAGSRACVRVRALLGRVGRAGLPGAFWCASPFPVAVLVALCPLGPLRAGVALLLLFLGFFFPPLLFAPLVSAVPCFPALGALGLGVVWSYPLLPFVSPFFFLPPPCLFVFFCFFFRVFLPLFFFFRALLAVRCRAAVSRAVGRVGVCCCGPCASAGARARLRSVVRCPLPVPPPFVLSPIVLCVPGGAVLAALLFPFLLPVAAVWCCRPDPSGAWRGVFFFFASGWCWLSPPPPPGGWLCCPVLWFVVRRVVWCCGLWCVLCCVRCCVACLCSCAVVCCCCGALLSCVAAFSAGFFFVLFLAFPWCSGLFLFLCSACAVLCWCACVVALCALLSCPCGAGWCFVLLSVVFACWLLGLAVLCCLLVGPGGSWCRVSVVCCGVSLGALLRRVAARCAARRCVVSFCSVWCCRVVCLVAVRRSGVLCLPALCFVVSRRAVCVLLWCVAAWCCSPLYFVPCASRGVVLCVPCPLLPVWCCCGALLSLGALLPCAVPRGAVLPCGAVVSRPAALFGLFPNYTLPNARTLAHLQAARPCLVHCLTCRPALVAVSWLACLGGCGVLDLTPRTVHVSFLF